MFSRAREAKTTNGPEAPLEGIPTRPRHTTEKCSFRCTRPMAKRPIAPTWELFPTPCGRLWDVRAKLLWGGRFEIPELFVNTSCLPPKPGEIALLEQNQPRRGPPMVACKHVTVCGMGISEEFCCSLVHRAPGIDALETKRSRRSQRETVASMEVRWDSQLGKMISTQPKVSIQIVLLLPVVTTTRFKM